jgi:hypothetical protein
MSPPTYLDPAIVTAVRRDETMPRNPYRSGYGPKIPTSVKLKIGRHWYRVYVMQWSNMGTPYVTVHGENRLLGGYNPF